jgi:hypothetical protein
MMKNARMAETNENPLGVPQHFVGAQGEGHATGGGSEEGGILEMLGEMDGEVYEDEETGELFVLTPDGQRLPIFVDEATGQLSVALPDEIAEGSEEEGSQTDSQ